MFLSRRILAPSKNIAKWLGAQQRDPRFIFVLIGSIFVFAICTVQAIHNGWFDGFERPLFNVVNNFPRWMGPVMLVITQLGALGAVLLWASVGWWLANKGTAFRVIASGFLGWILAKIAKVAVHRGRPHDLLHNINFFGKEIFSGYGFPSGHATLSAACATILYYNLTPRYRKYLLIVLALIGISRMYLGAHFPLDIVGGWALGAIAGSIVALIAGTNRKNVSVARLKRILKAKGYEMQQVHYAKVDARGSTPVFFVDSNDKKYFGKIFGKQEHAADWLFKLFRFFRYKNLQGEEPYLSSRRNIEIESHASLWAQKAGVHTPKIIDIFRIGPRWLLIQEMVDGKPLDDHKRLSSKSIEDAWRQVRKMHDGNMAHRDLRAANVMIDLKGNAWLIDFGFAEVAPKLQRQLMDNAELLASMSVVVGHKRTVEAALKIIGKDKLIKTLPYLHYAVFSGATTKLLKQNKPLLEDLRKYLMDQLDITEAVETADIQRFTMKKVFNLIVVALTIYVLVPQFKVFHGSLNSLVNIHAVWLMPLLIFSILTYVFAAMVIITMSSVPLEFRGTFLVQLSASLLSKIIPGGFGSKGLMSKYLIHAGMEINEVSAVLVAESFIGMVMFVLPLALLLILRGQSAGSLVSLHIKPIIFLALLVVIIVCGIAIYLVKKWRQIVTDYSVKLLQDLRSISSSPKELTLACISSFGITVMYIGCLYASIAAVGIHLPIISIVLIYATATIAKTAIPTPGGLGPLEIAMAASLVGFGAPQVQAYSIVLLYRLATYWLPLPAAVISYRIIQDKRLV